jgi:hypothetical protein
MERHGGTADEYTYSILADASAKQSNPQVMSDVPSPSPSPSSFPPLFGVVHYGGGIIYFYEIVFRIPKFLKSANKFRALPLRLFFCLISRIRIAGGER